MIKLGIESFQRYVDYLLHPRSAVNEVDNMIDVVTTHKTDFFREAEHFDLLTRKILPAWMDQHGTGWGKPLRVWSAGCSTGDLPKTSFSVITKSPEP